MQARADSTAVLYLLPTLRPSTCERPCFSRSIWVEALIVNQKWIVNYCPQSATRVCLLTYSGLCCSDDTSYGSLSQVDPCCPHSLDEKT